MAAIEDTMELPVRFVKEMKDLLGENYPAYQDSFRALPAKGLRINELKITVGDFLQLWEREGYPGLEKIPWVHDGFYIPEEIHPAGFPFYAAGLYYLSDPSAMGPAEFLPVEPGDHVLDLCASPGGKSVELAAKLRGRGILYANDISPSRAKVLRKNLERFGVTNAYVTAENPSRLVSFFRESFDKILVDAPCSGEGMFRSQPSMIHYWEEHGPLSYVPVQKELLEAAYIMLAPGGMILYSTCTYSILEDEDQVMRFLELHGDVEACELPICDGFSQLVRDGHELPFVRFYPHKLRGEGQFAALLRKRGESPAKREKKAKLWRRGEEEYILPEGHMPVSGLHYLMTGLHRGSYGTYRFEPSIAYAMSIMGDDWPDILPLLWDDPRVLQYLRGETILLTDKEMLPPGRKKDRQQKEATLVAAGGFPLGFGRRNGVRLKNSRPVGWLF